MSPHEGKFKYTLFKSSHTAFLLFPDLFGYLKSFFVFVFSFFPAILCRLSIIILYFHIFEILVL